MKPRSDGLIWTREDVGNDGTHPSPAGRVKVAKLLLTFLKQDPTSRPWFVK
jgi:lysophospholipase L1-like esterase